ncbi:MAG: nucleoid occlusion factor SlmA [Variovorax paradoxus]|uniref:Nucleoid occlusion factor SlmA n=1 Tax=Variovorax paradoxus TaxID=34073 RepID=A0A2W5QS05_VARPD|nr:MAG: nucleoid occlusion factor SlmA [Variovorax paradoxus]
MQNDDTHAPAIDDDDSKAASAEPAAPPVRKRPKPGERRVQILQALAARLDVSEAALYRHFASKAQMFEGLIDFIEQSVFSLIHQITERDEPGREQASRIVAMLVQFAEKNPGMTRVMVGDALVFENERLQQRMNLFFDKFEAALRQALRGVASQEGSATPTVDAQVRAATLTAFVVGHLQRFARSGFKRLPSEHLEAGIALML